jgi:hypothetical protein
MATTQKPSVKNAHVKIVVEEGRVTLDDLHKALDLAVREITRGGCNCGLTGFDISFLRGDPALNKVLNGVSNIKGGIVEQM